MDDKTPTMQPKQGDAPTNNRRKRWLAIVIGGFAVIGLAYGAYWATALRYVQSTDDAYVSGNVVQITPQISGTVISIGADVTIELSAYATPCAKNAAWFVDRDFRRMLHDTNPGWSRIYATVLEPGRIRTGDQVVVEP